MTALPEHKDDKHGADNSEKLNPEKFNVVATNGYDGNREDARETIMLIKSEAKRAPERKRRARDIALTVAKILFFPITLIVIGVRKLFKKFRVGIAAKTTVVFTVVFGIMLIGYAAFVLAGVGGLADGGEAVTSAYMRRLAVTSALLVLVFIILGAVLGGFSSQYMIGPVRKITRRVNEISDENMSARLDPVDSQDELMELTDQINAMLEKLQQAFERQENFVSDASHELKTPLSVIAGYANLLRRWGKDDPKILDESVDAISRESENMKRIVEQLLWLAKLGNFKPNYTEFNLYETVSDIVDGYGLVKTNREISLSGDALVTLNADKNLVTEAVRTLVDNAIKYTAPQTGAIDITIARRGEHAELSVADNGIGISEDDLSHIFERFYRCDKTRGRDSGSSGLGLTICKSIVEMMGGSIRVESELGSGSKFTITF